MKTGDIVKFEDRVEPCVVYRVLDDTIVNDWFSINGSIPEILPHIKIEVMGYVPLKYLVPVVGHPNNMFALDKMLHQNFQTN